MLILLGAILLFGAYFLGVHNGKAKAIGELNIKQVLGILGNETLTPAQVAELKKLLNLPDLK